MFVRLIATAVAMPLVLLGIVSVLGARHPIALPSIIDGWAIEYFVPDLPSTLELILVSFIAAVIIGAVCVLPRARLLRRAIVVVSVVSKSIPLFVLALAVEYAFVVPARLPIGFPRTGSLSMADHLLRLISPALVLTLFQLPFIMEYVNRATLEPKADVRASSFAQDLAIVFARNLPEIIGAKVVTELIFGWPGDGRLFFTLFQLHEDPGLVDSFLLMALLALAVRSPFRSGHV